MTDFTFTAFLWHKINVWWWWWYDDDDIVGVCIGTGITEDNDDVGIDDDDVVSVSDDDDVVLVTDKLYHDNLEFIPFKITLTLTVLYYKK